MTLTAERVADILVRQKVLNREQGMQVLEEAALDPVRTRDARA